jgi:hypothetical protein
VGEERHHGRLALLPHDGPMGNERRIHLWHRNSAYVDAYLLPGGELSFQGQDLNPDNIWGGAEYEYAVTVAAGDVPRVVAALGGTAGDDVLALVQANADRIISTGELTWLRGLGIEPEFWSRVGD